MKFGHAQKAKFWPAVLTFNTFRFLSSPLCSLFLPHFFSFAGHLVGFIFVGKVFRKAFRILGLDERKGRWVVEQDFHGNFQGNVKWFFCLLHWCRWLNCAHSGMICKISSLCTSKWAKLSLTIKTDDVTSGKKGRKSARVVTGGSGVNGLKTWLSIKTHHRIKCVCISSHWRFSNWNKENLT